MAKEKDPALTEAIRQAAPSSVEYRLYYGDQRVSIAAIELRLTQLARPTAGPTNYRRVVSAFLRQELQKLTIPDTNK